MVFQNDILAGSSGASGASSVYQIDQSIRFNAADSAYMQRTYGAGGNVDASTISFWFKRSKLGVEVTMFGSGANTSNTFDIFFKTDDTLFIQDYAGAYTLYLGTTQVFRDPSAWYHLVFAYDSANAIETERARLYINGQRVTSFGGASPSPKYPSQNADSILGTNVAIGFGRYISYGSSNTSQYFDGYLAEMNYVNGLALDPSYFGETNSNGIWIPKEYSGSYGTGGFFVDGRDASDLGDDESGSGNDLTTSGLSSHDQVADSPTNNFCTYNSIQLQSGATLSDGNLDAVSSGSSWRNVHSTIGVSSGKWYWEVKADVIDSTEAWIAGIQETSFESKTNYWYQSGYTASSSGIVFGVLHNNYKVTNTTKTSFTHDIAQGDIVQFQLNLDDNELTVLVDGVSKGKIYDITANTEYTPAVCLYNTSSATINFGQEGTFGGTETAGGNSDANGVGNFKYSVPSGYLAICTKNLGS